MHDELLTWCHAQAGWLRETIETLVRLESPSHDREAVNRCGAVLSTKLETIGGRVTRLPGGQRGDHVLADFGGTGARLLLLGHFDTVWEVGQLERMPLREADGRLYGPGVFDMKSGIGVAMLAVRALKERLVANAPHIRMLLTTDEEVGSQTSRHAIEAAARASDAVLVLEPSLPGGAAKTSRKGCGEFELIVHGISAHAGLDPTKGASAIHELAHQILDIQKIQDLEHGITVNVGVVAGGSRGNVVAEQARASIDVRVPRMSDAAAVEDRLTRLTPHLAGTRLEIHGSVARPPLERTEKVARLFGMAREAAQALGQDLGEGGAGGGSDGNFTAAIGVPTLDGLGPRGDGAHALHEHVELNDLPWRAAFLAALSSHIGRLK